MKLLLLPIKRKKIIIKLFDEYSNKMELKKSTQENDISIEREREIRKEKTRAEYKKYVTN